MIKIDLKGVTKVKAKGRVYYYAWRGGPRLSGRPGTLEFVASYNEASESRKATDTNKFRSVVIAYKAGPFKDLAQSTKRNWLPWLDRIGQFFGELRTVQFDRPEKIRPIIRKWCQRWADTPRAADYGIQVLSRVLSFAVENGKITSNPCEGIKQLYSANRSEIIWTDVDIADLKKSCPIEIAEAVDLAAHTGLRLGDLLRLSWSHIREDWIEISTGKSKHQRTAIIPLYDDLRALLARIPRGRQRF
jgi:integrase